MSFVSQLAGLRFKGFNEQLHWERIFMWQQILEETGRAPSWIRCNIILKAFLQRHKSALHISCKNLFLGYIHTERVSCINAFNTFCDLGQFDRIYSLSNSIHFNLKYGIILLFKYIPDWINTLNRTGLNSKQKKEAVVELISLWYFQKELENIGFNKYRLFVSFFDAVPRAAFLRELFFANGVPTATLQHGQFIGYRENVLENSGVEFRCFNSDYFLVWNKFTIDEAVKQGINSDKILLCGILGYIGTQRLLCNVPKNNIFGVVLGHPVLGEKENILLIQAANKLARDRNLKYFLKLHPNYAEDFFDDIVEREYYIGNVKKGIPMIDYASMVDFSIVGGSSVFVELVYLGHDVIRFSDKSVKDKFRDITIGKIFQCPDNIVKVFDDGRGKDFNDELFDYLCSVDDVTIAYKEFLSRFWI